MDILVRSWQDLGTILAKILTRSSHAIHFAMVRSYQESHVPKKNFIVKSCLVSKNLKGSQEKINMQIYIVRRDCYQGLNLIYDSLCCLFKGRVTKFLYQLQNRRQQLRRKNLELNHYPDRGNDRRYQQLCGC